MSFVDLTSEIATELRNNVSSVGKVIEYPLPVTDLNTKDWPVCIIIPADSENEFFTSDENLRSYAFDLKMIEFAEHRTEQKVYESLRSAVDDTINHFDKESVSDLNGKAQYTEPVPSNWITQETAGGNLAVMATVVIQSKVLKTVNG